MTMKQLKLIDVQHLVDTTRDGFQLHPIADQWAEHLPSQVPLRFSFFRYLGFFIAEVATNKATVVRNNRAIAAVHVSIRNDEKEIFAERVRTPFRNGVYYVQDIRLDRVGHHTVTVTVEGKLADRIATLVLETNVFEFMTLEDCEELQMTPYAPLRDFVLECAQREKEEDLRDDAVIATFLKNNKLALRQCDVKWWFRAYVEHTLDRATREKRLPKSAAPGRAAHSRKQSHPIRAADKKEHDHVFEGRARERKRMRLGNVRVFTDEPLHAGGTITVFSSQDLFHQLGLYAQV